MSNLAELKFDSSGAMVMSKRPDGRWENLNNPEEIDQPVGPWTAVTWRQAYERGELRVEYRGGEGSQRGRRYILNP